MKKRVFLPLATALTLVTAMPMTTLAQSKLEQIKQELSNVLSEKSTEQSNLQSIDSKIASTEKQINTLNKEMASLQTQSTQATKDLDAAMARVKERDALLKNRVTAMYEAGDVSYLDVLLGAKDFSDFIDRMEAVKMIVGQDTQILQDNKQDRDLIDAKKKEIEENLAKLKQKQQESLKLTESLSVQKKQKEEEIKSLDVRAGELNEALAEEERAAMAVANQASQQIEQSGVKAAYTGGQFVWPVNGRLTSTFGNRKDPINGSISYHDGLDIAAPAGTPIVSAASGTVSFAGQMNGYGNVVMVYHGNGLTTFYAHIRNGGIKVSVGQSVGAGQKIAEVGSTGRSTGNHCHFSVIHNGNKVDPMSYLR